jgi:hypothetical protein
MLIILYLGTSSFMGDDRRWMYNGWNKSQAHSEEWWNKTKDFIKCALSLSTIWKIRCPCDKCQNARCFNKLIVIKHLCRNGFAPHSFTLVFHDEKYTAFIAKVEGNDQAGINRMDEIVEAI